MNIFVSSSYADREWVQEFVAYLHRAGLEVRGGDESAFQFGEKIEEILRRNLESADVVVPILTERSLHNANVMFELGAAKALGKRVIPILFSEPDAMAMIPSSLIGQRFIKTDSPQEAAALLQKSTAELMAGV